MGIKLTKMRMPWIEMDISVGGIDKGSALKRFVKHPKLLKAIRHSYRDHRTFSPDYGKDIYVPLSIETQVAVFGDAPNDVPMFRAIDGVQPGLRVGMTHATDAELVASSNCRAEVSDVLDAMTRARGIYATKIENELPDHIDRSALGH